MKLRALSGADNKAQQGFEVPNFFRDTPLHSF